MKIQIEFDVECSHVISDGTLHDFVSVLLDCDSVKTNGSEFIKFERKNANITTRTIGTATFVPPK